jgi:hypothetical protein
LSRARAVACWCEASTSATLRRRQCTSIIDHSPPLEQSVNSTGRPDASPLSSVASSVRSSCARVRRARGQRGRCDCSMLTVNDEGPLPRCSGAGNDEGPQPRLDLAAARTRPPTPVPLPELVADKCPWAWRASPLPASYRPLGAPRAPWCGEAIASAARRSARGGAAAPRPASRSRLRWQRTRAPASR